MMTKSLNGKTKKVLGIGFSLLFLCSFWFGSVGRCAEGSGNALQDRELLRNDAPIHIASDRMEANQKDRSISFEGHVVVQQDDLTITGKKLTVYAAQESQDSVSAMMNQIDRIEVTGDVKISKQDKVAVADKAVYYHKNQKIVLSGNPRVTQGQDTVRGQFITLYLKEERSIVEGGKETPVQAILHPASRKQ